MPLKKREPKKPRARKPLYPVPELLFELLCTINIFEGTDEAHTAPLVEKLRAVHLDLKNLIGTHPDYQDNEGLQKLDKVYVRAGWDNNGLRWHTEDKDFGEDIFIVEFLNNEKTKWKPA